MPLGSIADAELDAEINAEANEQNSECDRDKVQRSDHPQADSGCVEQAEDEIYKDGEDDACLPQREPQHEADKKQRNDAIEDCAVGDRGKLLVGQDDRSGETYVHSVLGREPEPGCHFAYHFGCFATGLQITEIEDRLYVHEATKFRELRRSAGDQFTPGESGALSLRHEFERISERSEGRLEIVQLCFPPAHTLQRLRQRAKNTA